MKFELHIDGMIIENSNYAELKTIANNSGDEFIIYQILPSKMNAKVKSSTPKHNPPMLSYRDAQRAVDMIARGKRKTIVAKEFHVGYRNILRSVEQLNSCETENEYINKPYVSIL